MSPRSLSVTTRVPETTLFLVLALVLCSASQAATAPGSLAPFADEPPRPFETAAPALPVPQPKRAAIVRLPAVDELALPDIRLTEFMRAAADAPAALTPIVPAPVPEAPVVDAPAAGGPEFYTLDELKDEMKKLAWVKGDYKIVPYGAIWGSAIYATRRTFPGFFILYTQSPTVEGENDFEVDTRRTRIGLDVAGPRIPWFCGAETGGKVEIDFHGQFLTENQSTIQIRHAWAEVKNEDWRLMAGQNWDLMSPLLPSTVNYSVGWDGGNIGFRRMQLRLERYLHFSDTVMVSVQGAACQDIVPDSLSRVTGVVGNQIFDRVIKPESAGWPILEGRVGCTLGERGPDCRPVVVGVSGHIGEQGFDYRLGNIYVVADDVRIRTWSLNADVRVPVSDRFGAQGEFFTGQNLGTFFGGIGQGVNLATRHGIRSTGGWTELWYNLSPTLHSHLGYGVDNPFDQDITAAAGRTYNSFWFTNLMIDVTKKLNVGFEVSYWTTRYLGQAEGDSVTFEFSGAYGF